MTERRRIAVAVTLYDDPTAGGHVKVWQRWGEAIAERRDPIDLTLFFLGDQEEVVPLSDHVRCHRLPPVKGTRQRPWLQNGGGDTDLAKAHPLLAERAADRQVLHATDTFSFGQTFKHLAQSNGAVFLAGMQSDLERLTPVYAREIIARMLGSTPTSILFHLGLGHLLARQARTKTLKLHHEAQHLFLGHGREWGVYEKGWDAEKVTKLRRGIDIETFKPTLGDPDWLRQRFGIPKHRRIILFAGRVDRTKNAPLAAEAVAYALQQGHTDIHFLALGKGAEMETIKNLLGDHATLPGPADQSTLATAMASSDLFLFPSVTEVVGNVVQEAIVCGLPVMSHRWDNSVQFHQPDLGQGLLVDSKKPEVWGAHLVELLSDPDRLPNMAEAAKRWSRENAQSWDTVFERQLLPIWMGER